MFRCYTPDAAARAHGRKRNGDEPDTTAEMVWYLCCAAIGEGYALLCRFDSARRRGIRRRRLRSLSRARYHARGTTDRVLERYREAVPGGALPRGGRHQDA